MRGGSEMWSGGGLSRAKHGLSWRCSRAVRRKRSAIATDVNRHASRLCLGDGHLGLLICGGAPVARPSLDDRGYCCDEAVARTSSSESRIEQAQVVVVDIELGPAVWVHGVDPLAAGEEPVAGVAAVIEHCNVIIEAPEEHRMLSHSRV
jgi:hypothetical protein